MTEKYKLPFYWYSQPSAENMDIIGTASLKEAGLSMAKYLTSNPL